MEGVLPPFFRRMFNVFFYLLLLFPLVLVIFLIFKNFARDNPGEIQKRISEAMDKVPNIGKIRDTWHSAMAVKRLPQALGEYIIDFGSFPGFGQTSPGDWLAPGSPQNPLFTKTPHPANGRLYGPYLTGGADSYRDGFGAPYQIYLVGKGGSHGLFLLSPGANGTIDTPGFKGGGPWVETLADWPNVLSKGDDELVIVWRP